MTSSVSSESSTLDMSSWDIVDSSVGAVGSDSTDATAGASSSAVSGESSGSSVASEGNSSSGTSSEGSSSLATVIEAGIDWNATPGLADTIDSAGDGCTIL